MRRTFAAFLFALSAAICLLCPAVSSAGGMGGSGGNVSTSGAPEIDAGLLAKGLTLVFGGLALLRSRVRRR